MRFGKEKEVEIFKALAQKSALQVGLDYGFDKVYKDNRAIRNAVQNIYTRLKNNSSEYGLTNEVVEIVENGMAERKKALVGITQPSLADKKDHEPLDIKDAMTAIRDKTFNLINQKLDMLSSSKKKLDNISFKELGVIGGIAFDKTQILKGEATEHIAVVAKIDDNVSPEQALDIALRSREATVEGNTKK